MGGRLQPSPGPGLREPGGSINAALRSVRRASGLSLDVLATRTNFSKPYLSNVESGRRRVTPEIAEAYDTALGTGGLLTRLLAGEPDGQVGRAAELAELHRYTGLLRAGRGHVVWLEGEPGIGKSSLLAAGLAGSGYRVMWAVADESLARFPLWALLEALRSNGSDAEPERSEIAALLTGDGSAPPADRIVAAAERLVLLIERWCAASPVLVVLDDLQWADELSLSVWGRLRRLVAQLPLLLVGACRPVPRRPEVAALRRGVTGPDVTVLPLGPLPGEAVTELAGRLAGAPVGPRLRAAVDQAGGNPLYLHEMIQALVHEHRLDVVDGHAELTGPAVPRSLAAAIGTRLEFLSETARPVLRLAALLGPEPDVGHLALVTGRPPGELAEIVDEAVAAGVLVATPDGMAFRHGLIRAALYEQIPPAVRAAVHRQAAGALARAGAGVETVAEHLLAGECADEDWTVGWLAGGAASVLVHRAPGVALELIERVPESSRSRLAGYRVAALSLLGRDEDVVRLAPGVLAASTDPDLTGRTAWTFAYSLGRTGDVDGARRVLAEVLERDDLDQRWRARLYACDAVMSCDHASAQRALAEAERAGDPFAMGYALHGQSLAYHHHEPNEEATLDCVERALAVIGDRTETADLRALLLANRAISLSNLGRPAEVPGAIGAALAAAEQTGTLSRIVFARTIAADTYYDLGLWDDALAELAALADLVGPDRDMTWRQRGNAALIAAHRDDPVALEPHLTALRDAGAEGSRYPEMAGRLRVARAIALEAQGRTADAFEALLVAGLRGGATPLDPDLVHDCQSDVTDVVRLALDFGRRAEALAYTRLAVERAGTDVRPESAAVARHCQGLLDRDPGLVADAVDGYDRAGLVLQGAQARENQAVLLATRGDLARAAAVYEGAAERYLSLDAAWDLRRAEFRLRPLGLRPNRYRPRRRPAEGWDALTPTELKVAALVADGLSNPDVAARLHVSRRTVETHVAHILAKLGGRSRIDIARARPSQ